MAGEQLLPATRRALVHRVAVGQADGRSPSLAAAVLRSGRMAWRMPPLTLLDRPVMSTGRKLVMSAMWLYLAMTMILVIVHLADIALTH